jgi:hypothetical protein
MTDAITSLNNNVPASPQFGNDLLSQINTALAAIQPLSATEAGFLDAVTAGTSAASKAVVLDSNSKISALDITALKVGGTSVSATAAELNYTDITTLGTGAASKAVVLDTGEDYTWPTTGILTYGVLKDSAGTTLSATAAELNYCDITTLGAAQASKAVTADANIDVTGLRNVTCTGSFIIGSADMNETDLEKLDGITNGTSAANKAVVLGNDSKINELDITTPKIGGVAITATAAELNYCDVTTIGVQQASKAVIADANVNTGVSKVTALHIGASGSEVQVNSTAAELNLLDLSAQTETVTAAGAASVTKRVTKLDSTIAGFALTLAAPDATMLGQVKVIAMTVDNGDVTLALTNVQGGTAATTATWSAVGQELVLVAGVSKWNVVGECGVVLS